MRNSFKGFFSSNFPKFQIVKFNANGHNSAMRLNLFSSANARKDSVYNAIVVPTFDNKAFYSNFTYKYFNLKWTKFEQKSNYYKYVKTPSQFPNFLVPTNYFINSFLSRRRKKRVYKKRRIRFSIYFKNRFLRSSKSIFRSYRLRPFYGKKKKIFRLRKKLLRPLARKKTFRVLFTKYWVRRPWRKRSKFFYKKLRKFARFHKFRKGSAGLSKKRKKKFYFRRRSYRFRVFRFFCFKKNLKKIRYARRYAYRKVRGFRKMRFAKSKNLVAKINDYTQVSFKKKIFRLQFFKRLAKRIIRRRHFFNYVRFKLGYKTRSRIFYNKFGLFRFLGFKNYLLHTYFGVNLAPHYTTPSVSNTARAVSSFDFFKYFFLYPQKLLYSDNIFYFKFFSTYNILKSNKLKRFSAYFRINFVQYYYFYKKFTDFFSILSTFKVNFIPFKFNLAKKVYTSKFNSRISGLQYLQRRKLVRNLRFCTYFFLFIRILQLKRGTKLYRRMIKKLIKFIYRRTKAGRIFFFLPFLLNRFIYFGLLSHTNTNIYLRDPIKFNDFYSTKMKKSKFILHNKI